MRMTQENDIVPGYQYAGREKVAQVFGFFGQPK